MKTTTRLIITTAIALTMTSGARAQEQRGETQTALEEIIVTGTAGGAELRKQDASFSISTLSAEDLATAAPKSTAEIFALVPGIWAESSGGVAGANIDVRGLPGGGDAPFVTVSLNSSPIYGTDTLSFFEMSSIFRTDETIATAEALRGGPNAVFSKSEPGVTLNMRLKEGSDDTQGAFKVSTSDYGLMRADGFASGAITDGLYYMIGGYASVSSGIRDAQFKSEKGYQLTAHITMPFERGKIGVYTRLTDDHGQWYLPMALNSGNDLGTFSQLGDATRYRTLRVNAAGDTKRFDFADGRGWKGSVSGINASFDLTPDITLRDNLSFTKGSADTYGFVPDGGAVQVSDLNVGVVRTTGGQTLNGSDWVQNYGHWVVQKDLKSLSNDLSLSAKIAGHDITAGYYFSKFSSDDFWTLGNFLPVHNVANGDTLANVSCSALQDAGSGSGCWGYGIDSEGDATVHAFYLADSWQITDALRLDGGVRRERQSIDYVLDAGPGYPDGTQDLNIDNLIAKKWAWTVAANYAFSDDLGVFARYSNGFRFPSFDNIREGNRNVFGVKQTEVGVKISQDRFNLFATGFYNTNDSSVSVVGGSDNSTFTTRAYGVELDGRVFAGPFTLAMIGTLMDTKITDSSIASEVGNDVLRQPKWQFRVMPSYTLDMGEWTSNFYASVNPVGSRYSNNANTVKLDSYTKVDAGVKVTTPWNITGELHADNLFDSHGLTEGDPRNPTSPNGRPILGRSFKFSLGYAF